LERNKNNNLAG